MKKFVIILTGAPGSGKGYLASCLIEGLHIHRFVAPEEIIIISTGDLIRHEIKVQSELGKRIQDIVAAGGLVSDEIIAALFRQKLESCQESVVIIDGYPRTVKQVHDLHEIIKDCQVSIIHRDTPKEVILERISKRRVCTNCGKTQTNEHESCVYCNGELAIRDDDAVIEKRLDVYEQETVPALKALSALYPLNRTILDGRKDAMLSVNEILD